MNSETAKEIFPTYDHWRSFNKLADQRESLYYAWLGSATQLVRQHFLNNTPAEWELVSWGDTRVDTKWYLREFGPDSLCLVIAWEYELQLRLIDQVAFDSAAITRELESGNFSKLKQAFDRIDRYMLPDSKLMERRNYKFGIPTDTELSGWDLAWCAAFKTEDFVSQVVEKIERFVKDTEVTEQIRKLNRIGSRSPVTEA